MERDDAEAITRIEDALSGRVHPIAVCRWIAGSGGRLSIEDGDPLFLAIVGIHSETDAFDLDAAQRALWNPEALASKDAALAAYVERCARLRPSLEALLARLRTAVGPGL